MKKILIICCSLTVLIAAIASVVIGLAAGGTPQEKIEGVVLLRSTDLKGVEDMICSFKVTDTDTVDWVRCVPLDDGYDPDREPDDCQWCGEWEATGEPSEWSWAKPMELPPPCTIKGKQYLSLDGDLYYCDPPDWIMDMNRVADD